jgi:hypothetical protein
VDVMKRRKEIRMLDDVEPARCNYNNFSFNLYTHKKREFKFDPTWCPSPSHQIWITHRGMLCYVMMLMLTRKIIQKKCSVPHTRNKRYWITHMKNLCRWNSIWMMKKNFARSRLSHRMSSRSLDHLKVYFSRRGEELLKCCEKNHESCIIHAQKFVVLLLI